MIASAPKRSRSYPTETVRTGDAQKRARLAYACAGMEAGRVTPSSMGSAQSATTQRQLRAAIRGPVVSEPPQSPFPVLHTRAGKFRADDVIACMLLKCLPKYQRSGT